MAQVDGKYLSDAAHFPGGHAAGIAIPRALGEIPGIVRNAATLLPVGAQSSLTGGATPMGDVVLSTEKLTRVIEAGSARIRVEAGVPVAVIQDTLVSHDAWFPPAPTFTGALAGGIVATNAAGAATFRHGPVRPWVEALTVVLSDGSELSLHRGEHKARGRRLTVPMARGDVEVTVPSYQMPGVVKRSAGYHAEPDMDLVDLFVGSEGTLGVITTVTFRVLSPGGEDSALGRVCRLLNAHRVFDDTEMALPGNVRRAGQLLAVREAVPAGVNQRVGRAQQEIDPRIAKTAADMIVPFDRFAEMMAIYRDGYASRGLDVAVWGHISDGNVHPNVLPRSYADVERGKEAILHFGREVARLGGCPLAEHGVGRNPTKQALLRGLYGENGIEEMRAVKRALDPGGKLAPGVIF